MANAHKVNNILKPTIFPANMNENWHQCKAVNQEASLYITTTKKIKHMRKIQKN